MGFFDPPHRKILEKSPASFREEAATWGVFIELALRRVPATGHDLFRTVVIGALALRSAELGPGAWSLDARRYTDVATGNALRFLPGETRDLANWTIQAIVDGEWHTQISE